MNPLHWWRVEGGPIPEPPLRRDHASGWRSAALALALAVGCAPDSVAPPSEHRPALPMATSMAAPFDVAAAIDRVRFAFRADGDGWSGGHDTYAVHATGGALAVTPLLREEASAPGRGERIVAGAEATFHAASVARGSVRLSSGDGAGIVVRDGKLSIDRGAVVESLENRAGGVEQSWSFTRRPAAAGDVTVRIAVTGEEFVAGTQSGLHFRDVRTGLGVRYGHGTWVDAAGVRTPVPARWDGAAIVLTVPSAVVDGAAYPAALDPAIAPEFGVDRAPPGPADGTSPALASDGHVFLLVWQSGSAIVGAWLGPDGRALDTGSFVVSTNHLRSGAVPYNHAPSIASNGRGFLVAWITSYYTGTVDISEVRAVRVDQEHGVLDPEDLLLGGAPINNASVSSMDVGSNGRDYLVAWRYSLSMDHVLGARVSAAGALPGTTTIAVADGLGAPRVASDGTDYLVAMGRTAMRVGASGALLDPAPLPLPGGDAIVFDGQDYVVAWSESRGVTGSDLFAAHVSTGGAVREPMGIAVSTAPNEQGSPSLTFDGRDVVVAWSDARDSTCDPCTTDLRATALYAARLARSGVVRDPDGIAVTVPARGARPLVLASNEAGTLLGWAGAPQTSPDGPTAIYGTWLTRAGVLRKLRDPVLAHATNDQRAPAVAADGDGGFLVVWQGLHNHAPPGATRAFSWDILGARVGAFGAFGAPVVISDAAGEQYAPAVTFAAGRYLVAWQDHRGDTWDIYAARVTRSGVVRDPAGIAIAAAPDTQTAPAVAGGMVVWTNRDEWNALSVRGARLSTTGALRDPMGLTLSAAGESAEAPAIAVHGTGYRIAWTRSGPSTSRVVTAAIDAAGVVHDATAMPITETALDVSPSVACNSGGCLVAWSRRDPSRGTNHYLGAAEEIYGARVDNAGALSALAPIALVPPISFNSYGARFTQYRAPRVAVDGGGFLVVWESRHGGGFARAPLYDVLATRVSADTSTSAEAFAVASDDVWSRTPVVATNPSGPAIIAYARSELGPSESARFRVVARLLTPDATCAGGACPGASCVPGFGNCDGVATNGCEASLRADPANCGACGHACAASESCTGAVCVSLAPPRLIAPLSTATVTSRRPTLRWALAGGTDGARVEVCRDRACATVLASFDAVGASAAPAADLPPGVLFWRTRGRAGASTGTAVSPTWEFTVGARSAPVNASWGTTLDVNGDGHADVVVGSANGSSAYVYLGGPGGPSSTPASTLIAPDGSGGQFGQSVASAGDVNGDGYADLVVGAPYASDGTERAHVYLGGPRGLSSTPDTTLIAPDGPDGGRFGNSVASAGDVNGDGYADLVVGAWAAMDYTGRAYLYLGGVGGLSSTPATTLTGPDGGAFGFSVASAGDVNGDSYADLVVGAWGAERAYVYLGGASGLATTPATTLTGPDGPTSSFGLSGASVGDVNGDGYSDLVVGASVAMDFTGRAYVYLGGAGGLSSTPAITLTGPDGTNGWFGRSVASAGDVNGDGYADLAVGAPAAMSAAGRVYVYLGGMDGFSSIPATTLTGVDGPGGLFGFSVASAGDVDGDGLADLVVGAPQAMSANRAYVYLGGAGGLSPIPAILTRPAGGFGSFGWSVASATDALPGRHRGHRPSPTSAPTSPSPRPLRELAAVCMVATVSPTWS